jgi:group I intron endonuclease
LIYKGFKRGSVKEKIIKMKNNGVIYKVVNELNGEVYIGTTIKSIEERKKDHLQRVDKDYSAKFHDAISTYGVDVFEWEQIDTASSLDELAQKEKDYILIYNSKEEGYNADSGGGFKKTVYQYDLNDGHLINSYECLESAASAVNAIKQQLSRACLSVNNTFNGFYWSYQYSESFNPSIDNRKKAIVQFDSEGKEIACFKSIAEASKHTGINKSSIAKVCRGERNHAGGFKWSNK